MDLKGVSVMGDWLSDLDPRVALGGHARARLRGREGLRRGPVWGAQAVAEGEDEATAEAN
jgi:hypothetical protein